MGSAAGADIQDRALTVRIRGGKGNPTHDEASRSSARYSRAGSSVRAAVSSRSPTLRTRSRSAVRSAVAMPTTNVAQVPMEKAV